MPQEMEKLLWVVGIAVSAGVMLLVLVQFIKSFLYICRPNEVLIISGGRNKMADGTIRGYRVVRGGRTWRKPFIEEVVRMDMRTIPIELAVHQAYSSDGIPLEVKAIANVKISNNEITVGNAIERFLGRDPREIEQVARETLEGTLRGVLATLTPVQVNEDRLRFAESLSEEVADDFAKLGLHLDTLKIQHVSDEVEYLESIGRKKIAEVIKRAEIAESDATNEAKQASAERKAEGDIARQKAEMAIVRKKNEQKEREAEFKARVESAKRTADAAGQQARFEAEQELQRIRRQLEELRLKVEVEIPAEVQRRAQELVAKGKAAPIEEDGRALAMVLELLAEAWAEAGPHARDVYLIQQVEKLMENVVNKLSALQVGEVNVIDNGDGSALPNYVAGFPKTVSSVLLALRETTGVDIPSILYPEGKSSNGVSASGAGKRQEQPAAGLLPRA
ncbi:MAG: flotillin family protein [Deltaproteobacteria bacterium]|nr:flotillin family protein [Deltaproteobacteria bacterium]